MANPPFVDRARELLRSGAPERAESLLRQGLAEHPTCSMGWCSLADTLTRRHAYEEALDASQRALALENDEPRALISQARTLRALGRHPEAIDAFTLALGGPLPGPALRAHGLMELGLTLDQMGRYDEAWQAITLGQELRRAIATAQGTNPHWLSDSLRAMHAWLDIRTTTPPIPWDDPRPLPVFLVGVPRSGTTLMEQILVAAGCESTAERMVLTQGLADVVDASEGTVIYPGETHRWPRPVVQAVRNRFFDLAGFASETPVLHKLPLDLLHLGLIDRVFAGAPVIRAFRDPRDTVLSGYFQNLVVNPAMLNWTEPRQLALATRGLLKLAERYGEALPSLNLRVQRYEALTDDPGPHMRALVAHAGLTWTDGVTRFHELAQRRSIATPSSQAVTEPVHRRAQSRWKNYETQLAPILPLVEDVRDLSLT